MCPDKGCMVGGDAMRDAQAGVPSAGWLWAQLAFKNSMVHGILQFTPSIAFCYVLHRCVSRDIRGRESFVILRRPTTNTHTANGTKLDASFSFVVFLGTYRAGVHVHGSFCFAGFDNDPSAGSPTETLLRLLLPLNDKVQWNSRDVAGGEPAHVAAILTLHRTIQSVGATGGVYKGQGRSQRELMTPRLLGIPR
ncbi:hypothetical protein L1887_60930 [Cichorium endivia]|nr:hypothetical protein L1887_60930 [Cichorium endivia]